MYSHYKWVSGLFLALCTPMFFTIGSCRKQTINSGSGLNATDSLIQFSAIVNGSAWQTDSASAILVDGPYQFHDWRDSAIHYHSINKYMTITGYTSGRVLTILLRDTSMTVTGDSTIAAATYNTGSFGEASAFAYANNWIKWGRDSIWQQQGVASSGTATVSNCDGVKKLISGTFQFSGPVLSLDSTGIAIDTVIVTSGVFNNIPYVRLPKR